MIGRIAIDSKLVLRPVSDTEQVIASTLEVKELLMNQRTLLALATALTAFVLVVIAGLATRISAPPATAALSEPTQTLIVEPTLALPTLDPAIEALIQAREAAYQTALAEANAQLNAANAEMADLAASVAAPAAVTVAATVNEGGQISSEVAISAALAYRGGGEVREAKLERERGMLVYEVKFTDGSEVYVDATNGQVVYAELSDGNDNDDGDDDDDDGDDD